MDGPLKIAARPIDFIPPESDIFRLARFDFSARSCSGGAEAPVLFEVGIVDSTLPFEFKPMLKFIETGRAAGCSGTGRRRGVAPTVAVVAKLTMGPSVDTVGGGGSVGVVSLGGVGSGDRVEDIVARGLAVDIGVLGVIFILRAGDVGAEAAIT